MINWNSGSHLSDKSSGKNIVKFSPSSKQMKNINLKGELIDILEKTLIDQNNN